jgi:hypothetical protein
MAQKGFRVMRGVLGDALIAKLLWRSVTSERSYANGRRQVPPLIARRLDWIDKILFDLAGGYSPSGIRAWFARPRVQLGR